MLQTWRKFHLLLLERWPHYLRGILIGPQYNGIMIVDESDPMTCPNCFGLNFTKNGSSWSGKRGSCQEYTCNECPRRWRVAKDPTFESQKFFQSTRLEVFKAIALYALGLSLRRVERLTRMADLHVKRETIATTLKKFEKMKLWNRLENHLCQQFPVITIEDLAKLQQIVRGGIEGANSFCHSEISLQSNCEKICDGAERKERDRKIESILQIQKRNWRKQILALLGDKT